MRAGIICQATIFLKRQHSGGVNWRALKELFSAKIKIKNRTKKRQTHNAKNTGRKGGRVEAFVVNTFSNDIIHLCRVFLRDDLMQQKWGHAPYANLIRVCINFETEKDEKSAIRLRCFRGKKRRCVDSGNYVTLRIKMAPIDHNDASISIRIK